MQTLIIDLDEKCSFFFRKDLKLVTMTQSTILTMVNNKMSLSCGKLSFLKYRDFC